MPSGIWSALTRATAGNIDLLTKKEECHIMNSVPQYGPVKVSTGILKQDKRGVPSNHEKGSTLKLNADENVALAA